MRAKAHIYWEVAGDGAVQKRLAGNNSYASAGARLQGVRQMVKQADGK